MARTIVTLTSTYQQIAAGACVVTVNESVQTRMYINNAADDTTAMTDVFFKNHQFWQRGTDPTFARVESGTLEVIVDEE